MARSTVGDVGVLDKTVAILTALGSGARTHGELTGATGFHRATVHRLLQALAAHGLVRAERRGGATVEWSLGPALVELGRRAAAGLPLREAALPALERLRDATEESAQLYIRDGDRRVCVESLESPHGLRTIVPVGAVLPLDKGSAGKVLRGDPSVERKGWAESVAEREAGVASVSAPVRDRDGVVRAAVSVSGPIERTTRTPGRKYANAVRAAAREIERAIGWT